MDCKPGALVPNNKAISLNVLQMQYYGIIQIMSIVETVVIDFFVNLNFQRSSKNG